MYFYSIIYNSDISTLILYKYMIYVFLLNINIVMMIYSFIFIFGKNKFYGFYTNNTQNF